ncbi:hypothetical protein VOLCADRAFT_107183 [Volvox carteri f. nagariensis]|uniref:BP28 C-terminal domain-containing protein n=1 Tax=Volvox carteri f. nagariensis TaxID=3068 RepID=D8UCH0_VOLCA|nr:uncharacterized protein VOLCADRAFT_107183 [Volvox carteri f. nagariensis]EFJ42549.1 hypothetical protein VOLCADRAFT_107183 [Volvox carteri f. nagariensis]|eukprot:XP_002956405.1 hypothetical protein VOLCADRAFT_107183 [Volvox carteri f. nagariensis]
MTSVLASQLQALARQRQPALPAAVKKGKPSLLFDFQKAADIDLQTIYDVACQGLDELMHLEPRFRPFRESLFSRASLDINPDLQTSEFLSKLSESVHEFCCLLSNHFLSPGAFKALEYLIRRYRANERNVDSLLTAALPYHSTNEFVRLVQTLAIGPPGSLWGWLAKMQSSGASLPRDLLAQRCVNDRQLLLFICKAAGQLGGTALGSVRSGASALRTHSRTYLSFYAVLLCEVLALLPEVVEDFLAAILPYLLEGIGKGAAQEYRAATLMAVAELFSRATLGRDFVKVILNTMLKYTEPVPEHVRTTLLVMAHMAVTQKHIQLLSDKTLKYLSSLPNLISELGSLAQRGNIRTGPLLMLIVRSLAASMVGTGRPAGSSSGRRCEGDLLALTHSGALRGEPARALASALLEAGGSSNADSSVRESCQRILRVLDQRYPETTDEAVNTYLEPLRPPRQNASGVKDDMDVCEKHKRRKTKHKADSKGPTSDDDDSDDAVIESAEAVAAQLSSEKRARFDFVRSTFACGGYSAPCGGTMLTLAAALVAPQAAVRRLALRQLDADLAASTAQPLASEDASTCAAASEARAALTAAALCRLRDDDLGVVVAALGLSCLKELPPAALLDAVVPLAYRLGDILYGSAKLPQLKAARKAARKVVGLLSHVGTVSTSDELRQSAALHLLELMIPTKRDVAVSIAAARAASKLGMPLFSELVDAMDKVEAHIKGVESAGKGKGSSTKKATVVERSVVSALTKSLTADAAACLPSIKHLVAASAAAAVAGGDTAASASVRAQHLLLLSSCVAAVAAAPSSAAGGLSDTALSLLRFVVDLAEMLLPYARLEGAGDYDWCKTFSEKISSAEGATQDDHAAAFFTDPISLHWALILGSLQASLARLPETCHGSTADESTARLRARRLLGLLASLNYSLDGLRDLPRLVVTRSVQASERSAFLSGLYAAPASPAGSAAVSGALESAASVPAPLQCMALQVQAQLVTADSARSCLVMLLPALASSEASVRAAACHCLAAVDAVLNVARVSGVTESSKDVAPALSSALLPHRKLLCRDPDAISVLLQGALHPEDVQSGGLSLPRALASGVASYLASSLPGLGVDAPGVNTACVVLSCLVARPMTASSSTTPPSVSSELFLAGTTYLSYLILKLKSSPLSATALDGKAVGLFVTSLFTPATVAATTDESALGRLAEAAELPSPLISAQQSTATAALAAARLAAVRQVSRELFAALPGRTVRELFAVLLNRHECDPCAEVRSAARSALEVVQLSAEVLVPLLELRGDGSNKAPAEKSDGLDSRAKKKSKIESAGHGMGASIEPPSTQVTLPLLRDTVAVLELLQWRNGISSAHLVVTACQALLRRLQPIVGSISSVLEAESPAAGDERGDDSAHEASGNKSSLAGYAATLALQALTALSLNTDVADLHLFDLELAVCMAREAPDASVRNAALGLLAALATRTPEAALSHVLQVLAVVNQSAGLQDDEHSRAVGATALAAVVPAWVAGGRMQAPLWEQVVSSLPSLPAHRRLDVLLALLRALPAGENGSAVQQAEVVHNGLREQSPLDWLPELASQLALQLKLKVAVAAASASFRRPDPDPALDMGCRRLMEAALSQMQVLQPDYATPALDLSGSGLQHAVLSASRGLYAMFAALQGVMASDTYLQSLVTLLEHTADKVKRRALKLFTDKVRGVRFDIQDQIELPQRVRNAKLRQASDAAGRACAMLPSLLQGSSSHGASPLTRQLALVALATIATEFGSQQQVALLASVPVVLAATKDSHASVRASALATVAAFVDALKAQLVPVLPATVSAAVAAADSAWARLARAGVGPENGSVDAAMGDPAYCVGNLSSDMDELSEDSDSAMPASRRKRSTAGDAALELSSALACLNALVENMGGFLSPHLPSILAILLNPHVLACTAASCDKFAASIRARLPTAVAPRLLLPALYERFEPCIASATDAEPGAAAVAAAPTVSLLNMVASAAISMESKIAAQNSESMFAFLLSALDVRQRHPKALGVHGDFAINTVEDAAISAVVALVMKLSEVRFKPLFLRLLEWASTVTVSEAPGAGGEPSYLGRMVAMFGVVNALADRLRSVLVPYYRYLLDLCVQHLGGADGMDGKGARSKKKPRRSAAASVDAAASYNDQQVCLAWLLRLRIIRALHRCFNHDSVGFIDSERFARLQTPLHEDKDLSAYVILGASTRMYTAPDGAASLGPLGSAAVGSLLAMAVAVNNDALWKPLNHATLMLTRNANPRTRALALEVIAQLVERLREEYLVLLPEALPFFSELLEDTDPGVAARVREVLTQLEEISGEKLDQYLKI